MPISIADCQGMIAAEQQHPDRNWQYEHSEYVLMRFVAGYVLGSLKPERWLSIAPTFQTLVGELDMYPFPALALIGIAVRDKATHLQIELEEFLGTYDIGGCKHSYADMESIIQDHLPQGVAYIAFMTGVFMAMPRIRSSASNPTPLFTWLCTEGQMTSVEAWTYIMSFVQIARDNSELRLSFNEPAVLSEMQVYYNVPPSEQVLLPLVMS